jgi:hypothetical protein
MFKLHITVPQMGETETRFEEFIRLYVTTTLKFNWNYKTVIAVIAHKNTKKEGMSRT